MPKRKKAAHELTKDEAMKKLFRKPLRDKLHELAHKDDGKRKQDFS